MKKCINCSSEKGVRYKGPTCHSCYMTTWNYNHRESAHINSKIYRKQNAEHIKTRQQQWRVKNPSYGLIWREKNKEYLKKHFRLYHQDPVNKKRQLENIRYRQCKQKQACPGWVDRNQLRIIYTNRPDNHHVDHIIPLIHKDVCGLHVPWNLQYLPAVENHRKQNKFTPYITE
jgi:hypothetical protein